MTEEQVQPAASESDSVSEEENGELEQPATEEQPAGEVEGRNCALIFFDETNPQDAVVAAVYT